MGVFPMIKQRKIARYVLLQIITLGIYGLFFWSDWTEDLNKMCEDDDKESANYILVFILDIFSLGIYSFVWNYTQAERMYRIAPRYGIELKHGGSYVLLLRTVLFFLPVIGSVERIKSFNALAVAYNATLTEEEILAARAKEQEETKKKSKKEIKADKKAAKKEKALNKKLAKLDKKSAKKAPPIEEDDAIIPTDAGVLPGLTDNQKVDITTPVNSVETKEVEAEPTPEVTFEAPVFEKVDPVTYAPVATDAIEIPAAEELAKTLVKEEPTEVTFTEPTFEVVEEPVYEITDIEIPDLTFTEAVEVEEVEKITFTEPAAYEVSTEIADVTFIDDEELVPSAKEEVLKQATKSVGTKRNVKEKVAKEPVAKKSTKSAEEKATKATKEKKETATKSTKAKKDTATKSTAKKETTTKKETKPKTTKAQKEKAKKEVEKIVEEVKVDDLTFGEVTFEEVNLEADILSEIAEISKAKK